MSPEATLLPLALLPPAAILWYGLNRVLFGDVLSPFSLIFLSWILPLFLQAMNLSVYETAWSWKPALIVAWTTCALVGPCLLAAWFVRPGDGNTQRTTFAGLLDSVRRPGFPYAVREPEPLPGSARRRHEPGHQRAAHSCPCRAWAISRTGSMPVCTTRRLRLLRPGRPRS